MLDGDGRPGGNKTKSWLSYLPKVVILYVEYLLTEDYIAILQQFRPVQLAPCGLKWMER